jgi:hypothetical protein
MKALFTTWKGRFVSIILLTLLLGFGGVIIDPSYFQNPIGESETGILADEGYQMPVTTEVEVVADGVDPLQIDLSSIKNDFSGIVEVIDPYGELALTKDFALRYHPKSFLPNHSKWHTFYVPVSKKGAYLLRLTQNAPGKARVFFYQGPFVARIFMLPAIAVFFVGVISVTLAPSKETSEPEPVKEEAHPFESQE